MKVVKKEQFWPWEDPVDELEEKVVRGDPKTLSGAEVEWFVRGIRIKPGDIILTYDDGSKFVYAHYEGPQ